MLRVKNPKESLDFYVNKMGMTLLQEYHFDKDRGDFSLYFLASVPSALKSKLPKPQTQAAHDFIWDMRDGMATLELTWNHGTEKEEGSLKDECGRKQVYHHGNTDPRGFGHVCFNTPDVYEGSFSSFVALLHRQ